MTGICITQTSHLCLHKMNGWHLMNNGPHLYEHELSRRKMTFPNVPQIFFCFDCNHSVVVPETVWNYYVYMISFPFIDDTLFRTFQLWKVIIPVPILKTKPSHLLHFFHSIFAVKLLRDVIRTNSNDWFTHQEAEMRQGIGLFLLRDYSSFPLNTTRLPARKERCIPVNF